MGHSTDSSLNTVSAHVLYEGPGPTLGWHHDRDSTNSLQRCLADGVGVHVLRPRLPADWAIAPGHDLRWWPSVGCHYQSLMWSWDQMVPISIDGWYVDIAWVHGERLAQVTEMVEWLRVSVNFRIVAPVSAVVGIRRGQCVVLWGGYLGVKCFGRRRTFRWKIILSEKEKNVVVIRIYLRFTRPSAQDSFFYIKVCLWNTRFQERPHCHDSKHSSPGGLGFDIHSLWDNAQENCPHFSVPKSRKGNFKSLKDCVFKYNWKNTCIQILFCFCSV